MITMQEGENLFVDIAEALEVHDRVPVEITDTGIFILRQQSNIK